MTELEVALKNIETQLNKIQLAISAAPPCNFQWQKRINGAHSCVSAEWGNFRGKNRFWFGSDCPLPAKKFCDPCLAFWHVAVARNIILHEMKMEEFRKAIENKNMKDGMNAAVKDFEAGLGIKP